MSVSQSQKCGAEKEPLPPPSPITPRLLDRDPKSLTEPRERLEYLRDFLRELPPERFRVADWFSLDGDYRSPHSLSASEATSACGTAACIAGWTVAIFDPDHLGAPLYRAVKLLALRDDQSPVFFPPDHKHTPYSPTQAANALDHLIRTGEVRWSVA